MTKYFLLYIIGIFVATTSAAQNNTCSAELKENILTIKNSSIKQTWNWNNGAIKPHSIEDINTGKKILFKSKIPVFCGKSNPFQKNIRFEINQVETNIYSPAHLEVLVENEYEGLILKRIFKVYPKTPAVACDYYFKYKQLFCSNETDNTQATGAENTVNEKKKAESYLFRYPLPGKHWQVKTVSFKDVTDRNDNLVAEQNFIPYNGSNKYGGNLFFANDIISKTGFFILKEAPNKSSQINYPGYDFSISNQEVRIPFTGLPEKAISDDWIKAYTIVSGMSDDDTNGLISLRKYLRNTINYSPERNDMVMMNTWGDRGQDGKINELFILAELEKAHDLGVSVFQIDDGWQQGLSSNSAFKKESKVHWDAWTPENWHPHNQRFPNGFDKIIASAKKKNIQLGLWFNPTKKNSYATWASDAAIIIGLYKKYGIKYYKIDGLSIPDKQAEVNFRNFLDKIKEETNGEVFFNLDLTAGIRGGYFSFRDAGNLFLENRYTDWGNYYPFHTLRNVWTLSKYFPPELLQIEFLNKWRNRNKYDSKDIFAPYNYDFEYVFAITLAAQPLAWFESTGLPKAAFQTAKAIKKYREIQTDIHKGIILPIGDEPSGRSWTGFQSVHENKGYFIVYRELNVATHKEIKTFLKQGQKIKLTKIAGEGSDLETRVSNEEKVLFYLPEPNSYAIYAYEIVD